ncbi:MAG TPA: FAD-dependent oxidoreductase, partial [Acidobacteriota bacterium]|nr:FAD-dependent oxidoreductase [Acidobacteriota bacterium]
SLEEVQMVERLGVKILVNTEIGCDVSLADLESRHGAIFLGIGLGSTIKLGIPGEEVPGVYEALDFIERIKTREWAHVPIGKTVAVIGAGNTAVDAATQAKRLGAEEVLMIYRRSEREMPAYSYEYELAKQDAIEFRWHTAPVEILANDDGTGVKAVLCVRTQLGEPDEKGRRKFEFIPGTEFEIKADMVVKALGQQKLVTFLSQIPGIELDELGRIKVNPETKQTANPKYFAGGDCVNGGREAVDAAQAGKHAAQGIHELLSGEKVKFAGA